jgi:HD-GYP domain-containing protein (c-di-GMP phosphodiesterase class II)
MQVLVACDDVADLLVFRRLFRDTAWNVVAVRSGNQALAALGKGEFQAVIADDDRIPDMQGADLLASVASNRPDALRILLVRNERIPELLDAANSGLFQLVARPFFAKPVKDLLVEFAKIAAHPVTAAPKEVTLRTALLRGEGDPSEAPSPGRIAQRRILLTLAELVEARAGYSSGHGARVGALASVLGRESGLSGDDLETLQDAAIVHDVGEFAIDPNVLRHEGPLNDEDTRLVQGHVEASHRIVKRAGLPAVLLAAVRHHHERVDGKGYPDKLHGELIPLMARVIAVADTWDALATDRPYRRAAPLEDCVRELSALGGTQLDAQLVHIFLERRLYDLIDWENPPRPGVRLA